MATLLEPGHIYELVRDAPGFALIRPADKVCVTIPLSMFGRKVQLSNIPDCVRERHQIDSNVIQATLIKEAEDHPRLQLSDRYRPLLECFAHPGVLFVLL